MHIQLSIITHLTKPNHSKHFSFIILSFVQALVQDFTSVLTVSSSVELLSREQLFLLFLLSGPFFSFLLSDLLKTPA